MKIAAGLAGLFKQKNGIPGTPQAFKHCRRVVLLPVKK
jgi:hypothetical protein